MIRWMSKYVTMATNQVFKALADPTRREILRLLGHGEMTAGELAEHFDMTKPSVSHHFSVLKEADLVKSRREGQQIWYSLNTTVMQDVLTWALDLIEPAAGNARKEP
jgi:DNA-binding transcriptional ArsR family regulator